MMTDMLRKCEFPWLVSSVPKFKRKKNMYIIFLRLKRLEMIQATGIAVSDISNSHMQKL